MRANAAGTAAMRHLIATVLTTILLAAAGACGQMGPLYMPEEQPLEEDSADPPADAESTRDAR
tara:strand:+ start:16679 stop:16867 length:189 start_codon:yes stop_codon:yes gene_type:complete